MMTNDLSRLLTRELEGLRRSLEQRRALRMLDDRGEQTLLVMAVLVDREGMECGSAGIAVRRSRRPSPR